jgi:hypothetical protein
MRCLRLGEPGSLCVPARTCRPCSAARLAGQTAMVGRRSAGRITPIMTEAGVARQGSGVGIAR